MASFFASFGSSVDIDVKLESEEEREQVEIKLPKDRKDKAPVYFDGENVRGKASIPRVYPPFFRTYSLSQSIDTGDRTVERWQSGQT